MTITEDLRTVFSMRKQDFLRQLVIGGEMLAIMLLGWRFSRVIVNTDSPVVAVISGSMEPGFQRGDALLVTNHPAPAFKVGEVIVWRREAVQKIPIVHRLLQIHHVGNQTYLLTKGDNNNADDRGLYYYRNWIEPNMLVGRMKGFIPFFGMVSAVVNDYKPLFYLVVVYIGLSSLTSKQYV